jgi:glycine/D-amino acid oxidase-like deaminating enzyme
VTVAALREKICAAQQRGHRAEAVEAWIRTLLPSVGKQVHRWSGQVLDTIDYSAFIGRNPGNENVFIVTGDFRFDGQHAYSKNPSALSGCMR